ncbi:ComEC/Rec2 family competence protein [Microbacter sp. GSS18]|nr:ComEC/Rec2 family competence protein [Microbacter sp. GSS18]
MRVHRLIPAAALAWVAAAICTAWTAWALPVAIGGWCAAGGAAGAAVLAARAGPRRAWAIAALSLALAAAAATQVAAVAPGRDAIGDLPVYGGRPVVVTATVAGKVEPWGEDSRAFDAVVSRVDSGERSFAVGARAVVTVSRGAADAATSLDVGAVVRVPGTLRPLSGPDRAVLEVAGDETITVVRAPRGFLAVLSGLRSGLTARAAALPGAGAELIPGLAVGDTGAVSADLDRAMKTSSLSHLTAVSGANCALVVGLAYALLSAVSAPRWGRVAGGALALAGFVCLVTPEPSVVRAATMAAIAMLSALTGRGAAGVSILSLAVALVLAVDPWLAASLGFALSVAATAALLVLARPLGHSLERSLPRVLAWLLAVPAAAQIACGPLIVLIDPNVSAYGIVANLLAAPAAPAATVLGLLACLAAPLPLLADGLAALAWVPATWVAVTAQTFAGLPGSTLAWLSGIPGALGLALAGAIVVVAAVPLGRARAARAIRAAAVVAVLGGLGAVAGASALAAWGARAGVPAAWRMFVCDVGQGDALLLRSEGAVALVDTGEDPRALGTCLRLAGVTAIDMLVLTHFDADHAGAAESLAGRVGFVLHGPVDDRGRRTLAALAAGGARHSEAAAGMSGRLGAAHWRVLWPRAGSRVFGAGNDASVVLDVRGGGLPPAVLLGDLSAAPQGALARSGALGGPAVVVKVAHHGSADQDAALYELIGAPVGVVSVGAGNPHGHPRAAALDLLEELGVRVLRTDRLGALALWEEGGRVRVWSERGEVGAPG